MVQLKLLLLNEETTSIFKGVNKLSLFKEKLINPVIAAQLELTLNELLALDYESQWRIISEC